MAQVRANTDCVVTVDGIPTAVADGQPFDDNDDIVRDHPWLFEPPVEQATAEPGARRRTTKR